MFSTWGNEKPWNQSKNKLGVNLRWHWGEDLRDYHTRAYTLHSTLSEIVSLVFCLLSLCNCPPPESDYLYQVQLHLNNLLSYYL